MQRYATNLLEIALKEENAIMIEALEKEDYDTETIECAKERLKYEKEAKTNYPRFKCGVAVAVIGLVGACSFLGWIMSVADKHRTYYNTYSPITMPPFNFH
jgi:hypothetical protein